MTISNKKKWWVTAQMRGVDLLLLDHEEVEDCTVAALMENDGAAQSTLRQLVQSHPEKIRGVNIEALAAHAVLNDDPHVRDFAKQQIRDLLKARGGAEPDLVEAVMDRFRATSRSTNPVFSAEARAMAQEVKSMFSGGDGPGAAPSGGRSPSTGFQISQFSARPFESLSNPSALPRFGQTPPAVSNKSAPKVDNRGLRNLGVA